MKNKLLLALVALLIIPAVNALNFTTAEGGNITELNITLATITPNWQGYTGQVTFSTGLTTPGNVTATGSFVNGTNIIFQVPANTISATGFIIFSNSSGSIVNLTAGNLTLLDSIVGTGDDSGSNTFTTNSTFTVLGNTITGVPTVYTNVNNQSQNVTFREGYFNDAFNNLIFVVAIETDETGFDGSTFDYQSMLAAPNFTSVVYFLFSDLTTVQSVPAAAGGGSGGRSYRCTQIWNCKSWTACGPRGQQYRDCVQTQPCPNQRPLSPPTARICRRDLPRLEAAQVIPEVTDDFLKGIDLIVPEKIFAIATQRSEFDAKIKNNNDESAESIVLELNWPQLATGYLPIHQLKRLFWNSINLVGLSFHGKVNPGSWEWDLLEPNYMVLPESTEAFRIMLTPPAVKPQTVNLGITAYTGDLQIRSAQVPVEIEVNEFDIHQEYDSERKLLSLFMIIDNRNKPERKNINIEFNINKARKTVIAEYFGPYTIPANEVVILAQEYKVSNDIKGDYTINAKMDDKSAAKQMRIE